MRPFAPTTSSPARLRPLAVLALALGLGCSALAAHAFCGGMSVPAYCGGVGVPAYCGGAGVPAYRCGIAAPAYCGGAGAPAAMASGGLAAIALTSSALRPSLQLGGAPAAMSAGPAAISAGLAAMSAVNGMRPPLQMADALRASRQPFSSSAAAAAPNRPLFPGQPGTPPLILQLSANAASIGQGPVRGQLVSAKPLALKVGTVLPGWRVVCAATPLTSATGDRIPASSVFVQLQRSPSNPAAQGGPAVAADQPVLLAQGRATGSALFDANAFTVLVAADLDVPSGDYTGLLHVAAYDANGSGDPLAADDINIQCCVPPDFTVTVTGDPMNFGSVQPSGTGTSYFTSLNTPKVVIQTNIKKLSAAVVMNALALASKTGGSTIPGSRTALAWGASPAAALKAAAQTAIGHNTFAYAMQKTGTYTFYLAGRVSVTMSDPPGNYQGQATITVNEQ